MPKDNIERKTGELNGKESGFSLLCRCNGYAAIYPVETVPASTFHVEQTDSVRRNYEWTEAWIEVVIQLLK